VESRGIGTVVVIAIVAAVVIVATVGAYLLTHREGVPGVPGGLPLYLGAEHSENTIAKSAIEGFFANQFPSIQVYTVPASVSDVTGWYRTQMVGWEKYADMENVPISWGVGGAENILGTTYWNILEYAKINEVAVIGVAEHDGGSILVLAYGPRQ